MFLFPPEGPELGGIRYDERRAPLLSLDEILLEQCARIESPHPAMWTREVTTEGEHCASITVIGRLDGRAAQIDIGVVLLDDCYALLNAYCFDQSSYALFRETLRELMRGDIHFLGIRRRQFEFAPPVGWHERVSGYIHQYADPSNTAVITVWPALPSARVSSTMFETMLAMHSAERSCERMGDLDALLLHGAIAAGIRYAIILECDRYIYPLLMEADHPSRIPTLRDLAFSIRPIPRMSVAQDAFSGLAHWGG